jgi:hypothetical protein
MSASEEEGRKTTVLVLDKPRLLVINVFCSWLVDFIVMPVGARQKKLALVMSLCLPTHVATL